MMAEEPKKAEKERRFCPYCDEEIAEVSFPYCGSCEVTVFYCPQCREPLPRDRRVCPHCGAEIRG
ncbi:zinc ribbon domain-containing protein [Chloroflexota bacterium]